MYDVMISSIERLYDYAQNGDMSDVAVMAVSSRDIDKDMLKPFHSAVCISVDEISNEEQADKIAHYIKQLPTELDTLLVCSDDEYIVSTAIVATILRFNEMDEMRIWKNPHFRPDLSIYNDFCLVLGLDETKEQTDRKVKINMEAVERLESQKEYSEQLLRMLKSKPLEIYLDYNSISF